MTDTTTTLSSATPIADRGPTRPVADLPRRPLRGDGVRFGRVAGIQLVADWGLLVAFAIVTAQLGASVLPRWHPDWAPVLVWGASGLAALLFFGSILVHELAHALVARANAVPVRRITLHLFGGVAQLGEEPRTPAAELAMAVVGPIVSLGLGLGAMLGAALLAPEAMQGMASSPEASYRALGPVASILMWLGPVNVGLGLFNLVPGLPLDGGRVLRALLWWATGDRLRATRWASGAGSLVASALMVGGVLALLEGNAGSGLWLLLLGWYLRASAVGAYGDTRLREALRGVSVRDVTRPGVEIVGPEATVDDVVHELLMGTDEVAFAVVREGRFVGLVCLADIRGVPRAQWATTRAEAVMTPASELVTVSPETPATEALEKLALHRVGQLPVVGANGRIAGLVRRRDIMKLLALIDPG